MATIAMLAGQAEAYTTNRSGHPGGIRISQVEGFHQDDCVGIGQPPGGGIPYTCFNPYVVIPGPLVSRSPGTKRRQVVVVQVFLQKWDGAAWQQVWSQSQIRAIGRHRRHAQFTEARVGVQRGYYRVQLAFAWSGSGRRGARAVSMGSPGDYVCTGKFATTSCGASAGYLYVVAATQF